MIPAVAQTLADLLTNGSSLLSTIEIDLNHPSKRPDIRPALSLYFYDLRQSQDEEDLKDRGDGYERSDRQNQAMATSVFWFDLSFLIIAWDWTNLGQQRLLSEALQLLLSHPTLCEKTLAPQLKGYGDLPMRVATWIPDVAALWNALKLPLQPALYITIKTPFTTSSQSRLARCFDQPYPND